MKFEFNDPFPISLPFQSENQYTYRSYSLQAGIHMNLYDTVIQGRILQDGKLVERNICISDGRISRIQVLEPSNGEYDSMRRMGRRIILPGALDLHTHMREPGSGKEEDISSGTASAAFGGVCAVIDMPNTHPPTVDRKSFLEKKERAGSSAHVDIGLNVALLDGTDPAGLRTILEDPYLAGFKVFLGESTGSLVLRNHGRLMQFVRELKANGLFISIHAEDGSLFRSRVGGGGDILERHLLRRPAEAELSAVRIVYRELKGNEDMVHFLHISSASGLEEAVRGNATVEVTPHHLLLDVKKCQRSLENGALAKVNPPIRTSEDRARLWQGIRSGEVSTIGSDHAPHLLEEKEGEDPPSGMPGVETMVPLLLMEVKRRALELGKLQELVSEGPAKRAGLPGRGALMEGFIADLFVIDMNRVGKVRADDLHSRCGWSAYEGMEAIFPEMVMARGDVIVEDENLCSRPGRGRGLRES